MAIRYEFDWYPVEAESNFVKHHVSFDDAISVIQDPLALSILDHASEKTEQRWVTIGMSRSAHLLLVVHTYMEIAVDRVYIRIISARRPTKREQRQYEQNSH